MIRIDEIFWLRSIREKIQTKHGVSEAEVEWVLKHRPHVRFSKTGHLAGENVYAALGRTQGGRYLIVFFIQKAGHVAMPISARDMTRTERRLYARQKKTR